MAYVAVKGGERAIDAAHAWLEQERRGDPAVPELGAAQVRSQLGRAVDRVMGEGSLYDPALAALAIKQAQGDLVEAAFLVRAYRTTLPRFGTSLPVETGAMQVERRVSAVFKDLPGGQVLGPTYDYTHRLIDFALEAERQAAGACVEVPPGEAPPLGAFTPVTGLLDREGLLEPDCPDGDADAPDLTRDPLSFPADRPLRLQALARGDEGFLLGLGYSTQRGYGTNHPFVGEIRAGEVELVLLPSEIGFPVSISDLPVTECQMVNQFRGSRTVPPQFTRGYGLAFGRSERKAMAMALVDRALRARELGEDATSPAQDQEFVLYHCDNVEATGFVEHLKLPHYVDFQSELETIRRLRAEAAQRLSDTADAAEAADEQFRPVARAAE